MSVVTFDDNMKFYCVNLKSCEDRKNRMIKRFERQNLADRLVFIEAVRKDVSLIDYYCVNHVNGNRSVTACFASHLKAIRTFLESKDEHAIICEDDILISNNYVHRFNKLMSNVEPNTNLVMLTHIPINSWNKYTWGGINPAKRNVLKEIQDSYSTCMYFITRSYALQVLKNHDKPGFGAHQGETVGPMKEITSEFITRRSGGYMAYPLLAIEECYESTLRSDAALQYHVSVFQEWIPSRYSEGQDISYSPLSQIRLEHIWRIILSKCQTLNRNKWAVKHLAPLYENVDILPPKERENFLSQYYVCAFYHDKNLAINIANKYIKYTKIDPEFNQIFLSNADYIRNNFKYINISI